VTRMNALPEQVRVALDDAIAVCAADSDASALTNLAGRLEVQPQTISTWRYRGFIPLRRALQIEKKTGVSAQRLAPDCF